MTICALCLSAFDSQTSYGLCPDCWSKDRLREWDRLQAAYKESKRRDTPALLQLREWLTVLSDWNGRCAYCQVHWYQYIETVDATQGLVLGNVVPICMGCREHKRVSWDAATSRVRAYLNREQGHGSGYDALFLEREEMLP